MRTFLLALMIGMMVSSLQAGPANVRTVQPQLALHNSEAGQWYEVTAQWNAADFSNRRLVASRLSFDADLPAATTLELWVAENNEVLPWAEVGALPVDQWTMDARTETFVRFNLQSALSKVLSNGQNRLVLYIRVNEHQDQDVTLSLGQISDLALDVHHRPQIVD